jgi:hypothetical protein
LIQNFDTKSTPPGCGQNHRRYLRVTILMAKIVRTRAMIPSLIGLSSVWPGVFEDVIARDRSLLGLILSSAHTLKKVGFQEVFAFMP